MGGLPPLMQAMQVVMPAMYGGGGVLGGFWLHSMTPKTLKVAFSGAPPIAMHRPHGSRLGQDSALLIRPQSLLRCTFAPSMHADVLHRLHCLTFWLIFSWPPPPTMLPSTPVIEWRHLKSLTPPPPLVISLNPPSPPWRYHSLPPPW